MRIALVVAMAENRVIGVDGGLPWRLSSDLKYFKRVTMGKPIVMGRRTYESIGRPLPGRDNIVITRNAEFAADGVHVTGDVPSALSLAHTLAKEKGADEICVIGGGDIYRQTLPMADRVYLTEVHMSVDGDTMFPELDQADWRKTSREAHCAGEGDSADYEFVVLDRVAQS